MHNYRSPFFPPLPDHPEEPAQRPPQDTPRDSTPVKHEYRPSWGNPYDASVPPAAQRPPQHNHRSTSGLKPEYFPSLGNSHDASAPPVYHLPRLDWWTPPVTPYEEAPQIGLPSQRPQPPAFGLHTLFNYPPPSNAVASAGESVEESAPYDDGAAGRVGRGKRARTASGNSVGSGEYGTYPPPLVFVAHYLDIVCLACKSSQEQQDAGSVPPSPQPAPPLLAVGRLLYILPEPVPGYAPLPTYLGTCAPSGGRRRSAPDPQTRTQAPPA
ncbi:hypothetical protein BDK51DRAFT_46452 [Blyttiomyces helicus]|uniref:Uncharacterized protein n=1 Tax=Blyttiomyces helicus TaxID=388810 RepID=A0A4P9VXZ0_9FUNG|nr:hypothetical protein BDK51DRAFT_46452 [Blyttiomyces helicus]|eukprot:RKO83170.1 hypothetical protein BDK51DRAFT_46452 [Blyttiomyces helicus]